MWMLIPYASTYGPKQQHIAHMDSFIEDVTKCIIFQHKQDGKLA